LDEHFDSDIGEERGSEGDSEFDSYFRKWAEALLIVEQADSKQCDDAEQDDYKLAGFAEEAGAVNGYGPVEPDQSARCDKEFYNQDAGDDERQDCCNDGNATAEGDDGSVVSIFSRAGDEADVFGKSSDNAGENRGKG